jgi:lipopolysaccharide heptosyltransferase II
MLSMLVVMKILVRMGNWLGDCVMGTPALRRLAELYPQSELCVLAQPHIREILAHDPHITRFLRLEIPRGVFAPIHLGRMLRRERFDRAYLFPNSFSSALVAWWARIPSRVGYAAQGRSLLLSDARPRNEEALALHMVHYYLNLVDPGGKWGPEDYRPVVYLTEEEKSWAEEFLQSHVATKEAGRPIIGLNPGAVGGSAKRWPLGHFAELAERLVSEMGAHVLLFGSPAERPLTEQITSLAGVETLNTAGQTSLRQLAALLARCDLIVTNDTGGMHVADAVGARILTIFGPTIAENTAPFGSNHLAIRNQVDCSPHKQPCMMKECPIDHRCMTSITVEQVWEALDI